MKKKVLVKSAKEQFDADVKNATYIDEVAGIHYWYNEDGERAEMYIEDPTNKVYDYSTFPLFEDVLYEHLEVFIKYAKDNYSWNHKEFADFISNGLDDKNNGYRGVYCEYLFGNVSPISHFTYEDKVENVEEPSNIIGAECTDVNAYSSMLEFLKSQLIYKIEGVFDCLGEKTFQIRFHGWGREFFNDINILDNICYLAYDAEVLWVWFDPYCHDVEQSYAKHQSTQYCGLSDLDVAELLHVYSQLHK